MHRLAHLGRRLSTPLGVAGGGGAIVWSSYYEKDEINRRFSSDSSVTTVVRTAMQPLLLAALVAASSSDSTCLCEEEDKSDFSEPARYIRCLEYHGSLLEEYRLRWEYNNPASRTPTTSGWPPPLPSSDWEVSMLEYDFKFAPAGKYRDDLQFRLAAYYLQSENDTAKTFPLLQDLAIRGHHLDAMCFLGTVWMEGQYVDADPKKACVWFSQAADGGHRQACYEMGVALYTGEGMAENESMAVEYFERAASMGHPAAAYMLGDCLLDGVGVLRDRGEAMEWLVAAGEMGHRGARSRVLAVLEKQNGTAAAQDSGKFTDGSRQSFRRRRSSIKELKEEDTKWTEEDLQRLVTIERTFTIGGGSRNPVVLEKRKTVVAESREEEEQAKNQEKK